MESKTGKGLLAAYLFLVTSTNGFLQPFLPLYLAASGLSRFQIGLLTGLATGLAVFVQPIVGRLSDRIDARRPFVCLAALLAAGAYAALPFSHGLPEFLAWSTLGANGYMYLSAAGGVLIGRMVTADKGGGLYASLRVWGSVGYIGASLFAGLLVQRTPAGAAARQAIDPVFRFGPLLFLPVALLAWFLPDRKTTAPATAVREVAPLPLNLRRFLGAYFLYSFALYGATGFLSLYLKSLGAQGVWIPATFAAGVVVEVLVMRWSGRFSDRFGRRPALAVSFLLLPVRLLLYVPATGPLWVLAVQSLHGINFGIVGAVAVAFANDLATDRTRGHAQARLAAVAGLATALGPAVLGVVAEFWGLAAVFGVAAVFAAAGAAILVLGVEDSHPSSDPIEDHGPHVLRKVLRLLDAPPGRFTRRAAGRNERHGGGKR